jgi:hypothetical protein
LQADSFLMAMIEQVDITPQQSFEMMPKIGSQIIQFGTGEDVHNKMEKLRSFYKNVMPKTGWSKYSVINLQYKDQVVAKIKDAADVSADSLRTLQIMQLIAERAAALAQDSSQRFTQDNERNTADSTMILQSMEREEASESAAIITATTNLSSVRNNAAVAPKPVVVPATPKPVSTPKVTPKQLPKTVPKPTPKSNNTPKVVMPKGNN